MPSTTVTWYDRSAPSQATPEVVDNSPLFLVFSSFDRGPEDLRVVQGSDFFSLYGTKMNFARHGQPAIQAANIINGGGKILCKRLVAKDAMLANSIATATISQKISAIKTDDTDPNGKTINEIAGIEDDPKEYVSQLDIVSSVGAADGFTSLQIDPALTTGNSYKILVTSSELAPEKGSIVSGDAIDWDGQGDVELADGTKIMLIEVDAAGLAQKAGSIEVVSKIPHPNTSSTDPTNALTPLYITSTEGTNVGDTKLVVSPAIGAGNSYLYKVGVDYLDPDATYDLANDLIANGWTAWDGTSDLTLADGTEITLVEVETDTSDPTVTLAAAKKGASIVVCSLLDPDTRTSSSVDIVIPTVSKYVVSTTQAAIKWNIYAISNCKTIDEVKAEAESLRSDNDLAVEGEDNVVITKSSTFPVFYNTDNGRGESKKTYRFAPDMATSKDLENMYYTIYVYDGSNIIEQASATLNPSVVLNGTLYGINSDTSIQLTFGTVDGAYDDMIAKISEFTGLTVSDIKKFNLINATNSRGTAIGSLVLDEDSADLSNVKGIALEGGSNGEFGDVPFGTDAWAQQAVELLTGQFDNIIYDVDVYRLTAAFDANYPKVVKDALSDLVNFREDFFYFRDYGLDVDSYSSVVEYYNSFDIERYSRYIGDYYTTYQIYDPETRVRERVTMMYDFARVAVNRLSVAAHLPLAGFANGMILPSAIEGTINFTPRVTPSVNQKALLDDMRLNYAIFEDGNCIVQALYTSQREYTQLSFANNVIAIQETVRAVRITCPKNRFTFASGSDFTNYANSVNAVLQQYRSNFNTLTFSYERDALKASQKLFYATITYSFNNWAKDEHFDLFAVGTDEE